MTNYQVFDQVHDPVFTQQVNTFEYPGIEAGAAADAAKAGVLFAVPFAASVPGGQNLLLQAANPPGSGKTMYVSRIFGSSSASNVTMSLYRNGTFTGTAVTPVNLNFGSANTSVMTAQGTTGSLGGGPTLLMSILLPEMPFTLDVGGSIIVPPGSALTVLIGTGSTNATAQIQWWEY